MKVSDKTALLLKGVSMKDIKELEAQEKLELEQDEKEKENQDKIEDKPEEESTPDQTELINQLTDAVAAAVVEKLQLENINRDHQTGGSVARTPEEIAQSIFKTNKKKGGK